MDKNRELTTRITTAAVYVGVMLIFIIPGYWVPLIPVILSMAVAFLSAYEKGQAVKLQMPEIQVLQPAILSVLLGLTSLLGILEGTLLRGLPAVIDSSVNTVVAPRIFGYYALFTLLALFMVSLFRMWRKGPSILPETVAESVITLSSSLPLAAAIALLFGSSMGWAWFVLAILTAWISDTFSYFVGRFLGHMKFAPALSPKKTWEGTVGGIVGTMLLYLLYFPLVIGKSAGYSTGISLAFSLFAAVLMSLAATLGDLQSSATKRWCGIKDFGTLLPGHGGISDRFDSISATLPAMLLLALLAGAVL